MRNMKKKKLHRFLAACLTLALTVTSVSAFRQPVYAKTTTLKAPASVKAVTAGNTSVQVSWKKSQGAKKYQVYRYYSKTGVWKLTATTTASKVKCTGLAKNTTYKFKVRAVSGSKKSAFSKVVSVKTPSAAAVTPPSAEKPQEPVQPETPSASSYETRYNEEMLRLVNSFRQANGKSTLTYNHTIQKAADLRAKEAIERPDLGHNRYDKNGNLKSFSSVYTDLNLNIKYTSTGENLAWRSYQSSPEAAAQSLFNQWKNSEGHRANMLSSSYTSMATAISYDKTGTAGYKYSTAAVQLFMK